MLPRPHGIVLADAVREMPRPVDIVEPSGLSCGTEKLCGPMNGLAHRADARYGQ